MRPFGRGLVCRLVDYGRQFVQHLSRPFPRWNVATAIKRSVPEKPLAQQLLALVRIVDPISTLQPAQGCRRIRHGVDPRTSAEGKAVLDLRAKTLVGRLSRAVLQGIGS